MFNFNTQEVAQETTTYIDITRELNNAPLEVVKAEYKANGMPNDPNFSEQWDIRVKVLKGNPSTDEFAGAQFTTFCQTRISESDQYKPSTPEKKLNKEKMYQQVLTQVLQAAGILDSDGNPAKPVSGTDQVCAMLQGLKITGKVTHYLNTNSGKIKNELRNVKGMASAQPQGEAFSAPQPQQQQQFQQQQPAPQQQAHNPFAQ